MRRQARVMRTAMGLMFLALTLLLAGQAGAEVLKVDKPNQQLYPNPDFAGTPIGAVPMGAAVNTLQQSGDWYQVDYEGKTGWMHRQAFPAAKASGFSLGGMLGLAPARETKSDEVALAGKGFTPEVEAGYRQKHPELNFAQVDRVEAMTVDGGLIQGFIAEGGLKP